MSIKSDFLIEDGVLISIDDNDIDSDGRYVVPYGVTTIGDGAFMDKYDIKSVLIPNSVTNINFAAFSFCALTDITIPNTINKIGDFAFEGCASLEAVHISDLTSWCNIDFNIDYGNPLYYAHDLYLNEKLVETLVIPDDVIKIKCFAFEGGSFKEIIISNNVMDIERGAFVGCKSLESIVIPMNVKNIGNRAFSFCSSLSKVVIKGELNIIGSDVFYNCDKLKELYVCSEKLKSQFVSKGVPKGCEIIVDKTLNKNKAVTLGSNYLSYDSIDSSCDKELKTNAKKLKGKDDSSRGDVL